MLGSEIHLDDVDLLLSEVEQEASNRNVEVLALVFNPRPCARDGVHIRFIKHANVMMEDSDDEWDACIPDKTEYIVDIQQYAVTSLLTLKHKIHSGHIWLIGKALFMTVPNDAFEVVPCQCNSYAK